MGPSQYAVPRTGDAPWKSWTNRYLKGTFKQASRISKHRAEFHENKNTENPQQRQLRLCRRSEIYVYP